MSVSSSDEFFAVGDWQNLNVYASNPAVMGNVVKPNITKVFPRTGEFNIFPLILCVVDRKLTPWPTRPMELCLLLAYHL